MPNFYDRNSGNQDKEQDTSSSNIRPLSIEAPRIQNANQVEIFPNQPRQPADLQGLLRFAMEATKSEDAPNPSAFQALDPEVCAFQLIKMINKFYYQVQQN